MAIVRASHMQGIADGTVANGTASNIVGTGDTQPSATNNSPVVRVDANGLRELESPTGVAGNARWNDIGLAAWAFQGYLRMPAAPGAITTVLELSHTTTTLLTRFTVGTDLKVTMQDAAGAYETISPTAMSALAAAAGRYRFNVWLSGTAGSVFVKVYNPDGSVFWDAGERAIGTFGNFNRVIWGKTGTTAAVPFWSDLRVSDTSSEIAAYGSGTATLTASKTAVVEPGETITLTLGGGTTTSITQTAGPAVTLSGSGTTRTFVAPPNLSGTTLTFVHTVSGGSTASVSVAVLRSTRRMYDGAGFVALSRRLI